MTSNGHMMLSLRGNEAIPRILIHHTLDVSNTINCRELNVLPNAGADFVFEDGYELKPLDELKTFVQEKKHLPEIAPEQQMLDNGVNMGEFQINLLQKVEELTLYIIDQNDRIKDLEAELVQLKSEKN
jgi:hypothetical protein